MTGCDTMRYLTAGESHGPCLTAIIEGIPANVNISREKINENLARRQLGYGRGGRMKIEKDQVQFQAGVRFGKTLGSPVTMQITNRDWENWQEIMDPEGKPGAVDRVVTQPRPGHADLSGVYKYRQPDIRNVLERASARETAARVAVGSVAEALLEELGVYVISHVVNIGGVQADVTSSPVYQNITGQNRGMNKVGHKEIADFDRLIAQSPVMCLDDEKSKGMMAAIDQAKIAGDSLGGVVEVVVVNAPPGIGSHVHWDRKLDARIAFGLVSIQAIKGVEFGYGFACAGLPGSKVHDSIYFDQSTGYYRLTNGAGGLEGGMANGEPIVVRAVMKPIPTLYKPLNSVDIITKEPCQASVERSDICAVPACSVVAEAVVAWEIARAVVEKFGGDTLEEIEHNLVDYLAFIEKV